MLLLCAFEGCLPHLIPLQFSICTVLKKNPCIFHIQPAVLQSCSNIRGKYDNRDLRRPVEEVMQWTMVLIKGIQLVWGAGFREQSTSLRTCFEHAKLALLLGRDAVLSWCQRRGLFWELDWGTKLQESYLYSSFLFFSWSYFQLNSFSSLLDCTVVQMAVPAQGRGLAWG